MGQGIESLNPRRVKSAQRRCSLEADIRLDLTRVCFRSRRLEAALYVRQDARCYEPVAVSRMRGFRDCGAEFTVLPAAIRYVTLRLIKSQ